MTSDTRSRLTRARHAAVFFAVVASAVVMWRCNYSGSCTSSTDCTGSEHICVFNVDDGCGGDGHCAALAECGGVTSPAGCGCNGSIVYDTCSGGFAAPVKSLWPCHTLTEAGIDSSQTPPPPSDAGIIRPNAKQVFVHASPNLFTWRLCLAFGQQDDGVDSRVEPVVALPHDDAVNAGPTEPFPGVRSGRSLVLPDRFDLSQVATTPYVVRAAAIRAEVASNAEERTCDQLIGIDGDGGVLTRGIDYFRLDTIARGTMKHGVTAIVAIVGCVVNNMLGSAAPTKCGASYSASTGNLGARAWLVDNALAADASTAGAQFLHASSAWDGVLGPSGTSAAFEDLADGGDASVAFFPPPGAKFGELVPSVAFQLQALGATPSTTTFGVTALDGDSGLKAKLGLTLAMIQSLSEPAPSDAGSMFVNGMNYTFVLLGDPDPGTAQLFADGGINPLFDGHGAHVIAVPSDPKLPTP